MLWTIFVILLVLWLFGLVSSYTLGGFIHLLLVIAVIVLVCKFQNYLGSHPILVIYHSRIAWHPACFYLIRTYAKATSWVANSLQKR